MQKQAKHNLSVLYCRELELYDAYLPIIELAAALGRDNIFFGDCCFGGQRIGETLACVRHVLLEMCGFTSTVFAFAVMACSQCC